MKDTDSNVNNSKDRCMVCKEEIPEDYDKFDARAPVYTDDGIYHLGCENEVFEEIKAEVGGGGET